MRNFDCIGSIYSKFPRQVTQIDGFLIFFFQKTRYSSGLTMYLANLQTISVYHGHTVAPLTSSGLPTRKGFGDLSVHTAHSGKEPFSDLRNFPETNSSHLKNRSGPKRKGDWSSKHQISRCDFVSFREDNYHHTLKDKVQAMVPFPDFVGWDDTREFPRSHSTTEPPPRNGARCVTSV